MPSVYYRWPMFRDHREPLNHTPINGVIAVYHYQSTLPPQLYQKTLVLLKDKWGFVTNGLLGNRYEIIITLIWYELWYSRIQPTCVPISKTSPLTCYWSLTTRVRSNSSLCCLMSHNTIVVINDTYSPLIKDINILATYVTCIYF